MIKQNKTIKIILTGGGTVGHIKPILIVKDKLEEECKRLGLKPEFFYIGSKTGPEAQIIPKKNIKFKGISTGKLRRYFDWQNLVDPLKISVGFLQSISILMKFKPDVIFAKGGYVTTPVIYAAAKLNIPIVIHESDVIMGIANKFALKYAKKVCVGFPLKYYKDISIDKIVYTGNPVEIVTSNKQQVTSKKKKNISEKPRATLHKPILLIMGGSQGSRFINQIVVQIMLELTKEYKIIHICGKNDYNWLRKNKWENYKLYDFTDELPEYISQADLIISRAGANSLAEISAAGKPSIIIPLPSAANDHQKANAQIYAKANAAIMVSEDKLSSQALKELIDRLMGNKDLRKLMSLSTKNLAQPGAARLIAKEILNQMVISDDQR